MFWSVYFSKDLDAEKTRNHGSGVNTNSDLQVVRHHSQSFISFTPGTLTLSLTLTLDIAKCIHTNVSLAT